MNKTQTKKWERLMKRNFGVNWRDSRPLADLLRDAEERAAASVRVGAEMLEDMRAFNAKQNEEMELLVEGLRARCER